ncbi:MAG: DUF2283 domain-containing protein [Acetobacter okinawensis]
MLTTTYDPEADAFYARFRLPETQVARTQEVSSGEMLDFDENSNTIGVEVLNCTNVISGLRCM